MNSYVRHTKIIELQLNQIQAYMSYLDKLFLIVSFCSFYFLSQAQHNRTERHLLIDTIFTKKGDIIPCHIRKISKKGIAYRPKFKGAINKHIKRKEVQRYEWNTEKIARCKYVILEQDKFTKSKKVATWIFPITKSIFKSGPDLGFRAHDQNVVMCVAITAEKIFSISTEDEFMFLFDNDKTMAFSPIQHEIADTDFIVNGEKWQAMVWYEVKEPEVLQARLSEWTITDYRVNTDEGYIDGEVGEKKTAEISKLLNCTLDAAVLMD